jgi:hypothetical protein
MCCFILVLIVFYDAVVFLLSWFDEFGDEFGGRIRGRIRGARKFGERKIRGGHKIRGAKIKFGEPKSNSGSGNQIRGAETKFGEPNQIRGAKIRLRLLSRRYKCASIVEDLSGAGAHMSLMGPGPGPGRKRARGRGRRRRRKTLPQSIQVPSFQHPGTSYPVRGTPQSDL